ncbi:MAG: ABC-type transport auxiliary lipoprotein family protein [Sphingomonadaceae bacterium]
MKKFTVLMLALTSLTACVSLGGKPARSLLTISPVASLPAGEVRTARAGDGIAVAIPTVPQSLATVRVAVTSNATEIAYLKDTAWVEAPARLFQRILAETVAVKTGKIVFDIRRINPEPGVTLTGALTHFGIDATAREAIVTYDAVQTRAKSTELVTRRFEAHVPIATIDSASAGVALNKAANQVAADVAAWVAG